MNINYLLSFAKLVKCIFSRLITNKDKKGTIWQFMHWFYELTSIMDQLFIEMYDTENGTDGVYKNRINRTFKCQITTVNKITSFC